ncbi:MAG: thioredoxin-disulfide reductase [Alphaproteobacteria bacterium]|nr:thioredoxin-disulfide reductase [Alphaproteobacteria bacterium]MDD9920631.1 thioredoxin-disulfide reductase [Alphaproteobacteria bacterium]
MSQHHKLIILGSGPAGCTAAIYAARAGVPTTLIHGLQPGGQLTITTDVENYPGFAEPVQGPWLMEQFQKQAENCGTTMVQDYIKEAQVTEKPFTLIGEKDTYTCDALIIATGASAKWLGIESEEKYNGRGVSACATCDGAFYKNRDVAVVGGGNTALEEALYLANICNKVTIIHRRDEFRGEKILHQRVFNHPKIEVLWNSTVDEILGDMMGVNAVRVENTQSSKKAEIPVHGVFIAIGHKPNTGLFKGQLNMNDIGYLEVEAGTVNTNIAGVFAAGDVADEIYRQAVTAAGLGCMAALDAARYLDTLEG